jgi:hypothetical protein
MMWSKRFRAWIENKRASSARRLAARPGSCWDADERGASAVVGSVLMLALTVGLAASAVPMFHAFGDEMDAQRVAAEQAAWCARHPSATNGSCSIYGNGAAPPGYACSGPNGAGVVVCAPQGATLAQNSTATAPGSPVPGVHVSNVTKVGVR